MRRRETAMPEGVSGALTAVRAMVARWSAEKFLLFVGYPRSGHSLVGQLLDAHPKAVVAHEVHVGRLLVEGGWKGNRILSGILVQRRDFEAMDFEWAGHSYKIEGGWQNRSVFPMVIGDKGGGKTSQLLRYEPGLIGRLAETINMPIAVIHVLRNPLDNIATMVLKGHGNVEKSTRQWLQLNEAVETARRREDWLTWIDVQLDELVADSRAELDRVRTSLGLPSNNTWLEVAASFVSDSPSRTRTKVDWPEGALDQLRCAGFETR
jgi:hypothetical protein